MALTVGELNLIIGACATAVAIIAFGNDIAVTRKLKIFGNILFKLVITIIAFFIGTWASNEKDKLNSNEINKINNEQTDRYTKKVNEVYLGLKAENLKSTAQIANILGKYGYKVDTLKQELVKLKDSIRKSKVEVEPNLAISSFSNDGIVNGKRHYTISLVHLDAQAINFDISKGVVLFDSIGYRFLMQDDFLVQTDMISPGFITSNGFNVPLNINPIYIYVLIKGTYANIHNAKPPHSIDRIYMLDIKNNKFGEPTIENIKTDVRNLIKQY
jgi:hypothetical protein